MHSCMHDGRNLDWKLTVQTLSVLWRKPAHNIRSVTFVIRRRIEEQTEFVTMGTMRNRNNPGYDVSVICENMQRIKNADNLITDSINYLIKNIIFQKIIVFSYTEVAPQPATLTMASGGTVSPELGKVAMSIVSWRAKGVSNFTTAMS